MKAELAPGCLSISGKEYKEGMQDGSTGEEGMGRLSIALSSHPRIFWWCF